MTGHKRYYFDELKALYGVEVTGHEDTHGWLCYDTFVAEGNSLPELLDNCGGFTMDQDGGEGFEVSFHDLPERHQRALQVEIEERLMKRHREALGEERWHEMVEANRKRED